MKRRSANVVVGHELLVDDHAANGGVSGDGTDRAGVKAMVVGVVLPRSVGVDTNNGLRHPVRHEVVLEKHRASAVECLDKGREKHVPLSCIVDRRIDKVNKMLELAG